MKKSVAMKWVRALRSGKYNQTQGTLRNSQGYCCLGVLCDISKEGEWAGNHYWGSLGSTTGVLPKVVQIYAGMSNLKGEHTTHLGERRSLVGYNDAHYTDPKTGKKRSTTFQEIADWIEINYKAL